MTRIFVQRGSSSNSNRPPSNSTPPSSQASSTSKDDPEKQIIEDQNVIEDSGDRLESVEDKISKHDESSQVINVEGATNVYEENKSSINDVLDSSAPRAETSEHHLGQEDALRSGIVPLVIGSPQIATGASYPPPPPAPPLKPFLTNQSSRRMGLGSSNSVRIGSSRRQTPWPVVGARSPSNSRPSSPMSYGEGDGYNSADEQGPGYATSYGDVERERLFVLEIRRTKGFEVRKMLEDGNCLFRAVADQVYGDAEAYDMARQMCVDYLEKERDHFSQFLIESFTLYCKRKRRDKVYGNNIEIQAFAEMYNRPIHIYSYSTEPINIFQGSYVTDVPPIRLSYHHGNHYNSLVDPRRMTVGAGLGFNSLRGRNIDKDQIKTAIKAQQDQQLDNALIAEGRFYSDLELTEKEIERMVMEASRAEYLAKEKLKQYAFSIESSTSSAEPSSSVAKTGSSQSILEGENEKALLPEIILSSSMQMVLSMGFGYMQAMEAYSIFGDDVDSMICYLLEMGNNGASAGERRNGYKGKAAE
ncbi:OVARIAN TUMOR DOMAIN-containing deubiquitinating enzyme 6-like [Zingiber officinale]|uniref:OVARIAN TUMOR DOMAIN-containing deubiquitinating enzyme 6-like n=1 Tax=Zingiber officinale TaxID=94328 RepID=UPI001C4AFC18|nr:OVARIAN TUMOR DOMAIN-containing deubiquitinating enzyme 6-like [Zingiber officinale]XP_042437340.1 OVARIAN TUMOR DOMAIN-containing deubiquitinating enzyme 6-like [Zingiber officinale]XP_042437341.1 OVARIAN TUMOR DOMAIN-containing deubiquitinating enzyme 6-like [Zingiber officinale]